MAKKIHTYDDAGQNMDDDKYAEDVDKELEEGAEDVDEEKKEEEEEEDDDEDLE